MSEASPESKRPETPKVDNLDEVVYAAASQPESLDMENWHTCDNTHCRAGWIVHLAGDKGRELEQFFDTSLAAMLIYNESTGRSISPVRFFESNEVALKSMKEAAEKYGKTVK